MTYQYKPAEAGIINKLDAMPDGEAMRQAVNYLVSAALSPDAFTAWQSAKLAAAKASSGNGGKITPKVSGKGALSLYGLGRWPVTLYKEQWQRVLADGGKFVLEFIAAHDSELASKGDEKPAAQAA